MPSSQQGRYSKVYRLMSSIHMDSREGLLGVTITIRALRPEGIPHNILRQLYRDIRDQVSRAAKRWRDLEVRIRLSMAYGRIQSATSCLR